MKKLLVIFITLSAIMLPTVMLQAMKTDIVLNGNEITLDFENIKIRDIKYVEGNKLVIIHAKSEKIDLEIEKNKVEISASKLTKIKLHLPNDKKYTMDVDKGKIIFTEKVATIFADDGEIVEFSPEGLYVQTNNEEVRIGRNGILVNSDDENVCINSEGIIVESRDEEDTVLTNFWGQMLGGFIGFVTKAAVSLIGDDSSKIVKLIINDEISGNNSTFNFNMNLGDDESGEKAMKNMVELYSVKSGTTLTLENRNGSIDLLPSDNNQMKIEVNQISRRGEEAFENVEIKISDGKDFRIETIYKTKNPHVSTSYKIYVPDMVEIGRIISSNGKVSLEGLKGDAVITTSNGKVVINGFTGDVRVHTSNGSILLDGVSGKASLKTSNAKIKVANCPGLESARTSNGSISTEMTALSKDLVLDTSNANIALYLPKTASATVSGETSNGSIKTYDLEFSDFVQRSGHISGKLGSGKFNVYISTSNGNLKIYAMETWR